MRLGCLCDSSHNRQVLLSDTSVGDARDYGHGMWLLICSLFITLRVFYLVVETNRRWHFSLYVVIEVMVEVSEIVSLSLLRLFMGFGCYGLFW